jgi:hypothetical protein
MMSWVPLPSLQEGKKGGREGGKKAGEERSKRSR